MGQGVMAKDGGSKYGVGASPANHPVPQCSAAVRERRAQPAGTDPPHFWLESRWEEHLP